MDKKVQQLFGAISVKKITLFGKGAEWSEHKTEKAWILLQNIFPPQDEFKSRHNVSWCSNKFGNKLGIFSSLTANVGSVSRVDNIC